MGTMLYFKVTPDNYLTKKGYHLNRFNFFPRENDDYINDHDQKYYLFLNCSFEMIFALFKEYSLIMDVHCLDLKKIKPQVETFFVDFYVSNYNIGSIISFELKNVEVLSMFIKTFCPWADDLAIRVVDRPDMFWAYPKNNSCYKYYKIAHSFNSFIRLSVNPIFVEILSEKNFFNDFECVIASIAKKYNFNAKMNNNER